MQFKSMDTAPIKPAVLPVTWETRMPWGQHAGRTVEQVSNDDPCHAYGYFNKLHEVGKIKMDRECQVLLEEAFDSCAEERDGPAGDGY